MFRQDSNIQHDTGSHAPPGNHSSSGTSLDANEAEIILADKCAPQKQGDAHIRMTGTLVDNATGRSSELSDIVQKIATDKTALITTLENLKTQQHALKGEGDRLERRFQRIDEITEVVDDNNTETVQKLQVLLDESCLTSLA